MPKNRHSNGVVNGIDTDALNETIEAVREVPARAQATFRLDSEWQNGCHQTALTGTTSLNGEALEGRTARYSLSSDEPEALLGTDRGASPAEYVLQALAGCYAVTFATNAAIRGIALTELRFELEGDVDLQGFLNVDGSVRPGVSDVRVTVHAEATNADRGRLQELVSAVERLSPIRDTLVNPVRVTTTLG